MGSQLACLALEPDRSEVARERLFRLGPGALTDVELLALLWADGVEGPLLGKARSLLGKAGGLKALFGAEYPELCEGLGLSPKKAAQVAAVQEVSRRLLRKDNPRPALRTPEEAYDYLRPSLHGMQQEVFRVLCLNTRKLLLADAQVGQGGIAKCPVDPREVFHAALSVRATSLILVHNHPSGDPEPSASDITLTHQLVAGARLLCLTVEDHLIFGNLSYSSLRARGILGG